MLKPALARGEIQCIGATTLDEYRQNIEKMELWSAVSKSHSRAYYTRRNNPNSANIKEKYEDHHNVNYTDAALEACVKLTERYITDRNFPDKAIDALDEAGSRVHLINISAPKEIEEQEKLIDEMKSLKMRLSNCRTSSLPPATATKKKNMQHNWIY